MNASGSIRTTRTQQLRHLAAVALGVAAMTSASAWAQVDAAVEATTQTLWIQSERLAFGVGNLSTARSPWSIASNTVNLSGAATSDSAMQRTYAVGFHVTPSTMLSWESPASSFQSHQQWMRSQDHRVGLTFKSESASKDIKSLMTVQLSGTSVLNFRPRAGGMRVTYAVTF